MDTLCDFHQQASAKEVGGAAAHAETEKVSGTYIIKARLCRLHSIACKTNKRIVACVVHFGVTAVHF